MKVITRCVIDMKTLKVVEEHSYEYSGPVAECKGGGGNSGKVGFPAYMEAAHGQWLDNSGVDDLTLSMVDAMNAAHGNSPWIAQTAYDPTIDITAWETAISALQTLIAGIDEVTDWAGLYGQADTTIDGVLETEIAQSISDFADVLDDEIESKVLPRFRRGMQDINAVQSSAFIIGASLIESFRNRDVAKHGSELRVAMMDKKLGMNIAGTEQMIRLLTSKYGLEDSYARLVVDSRKLKILAKSEQSSADAKYDEADALWDLKVFQYGASLLGGIGGGTPFPPEGPSQEQQALGGAMTGAAAGASFGPWGAVVGGVLGAASAYL